MAISRSSGGISSLIKEVQYQDAVSRTGGKVTQQVQEIESESEDIVIPPPTLPLPQTTSDDASKMQKDAVLSPSPQAPSPQASSADSTLYDNKQWESELNPLVVRKNNTESNWVRDVIGYFIVINWLLGAIAFVFTFNWNDTSNRNDMKRSVIIFFFGFWGFLMFEF